MVHAGYFQVSGYFLILLTKQTYNLTPLPVTLSNEGIKTKDG